MPEEPEIEIIEKPVDITKEEVDYSDHCTDWEYHLATQYPTKIVRKMARRGNLSETCELFILQQRKIKNKKWEPLD